MSDTDAPETIDVTFPNDDPMTATPPITINGRAHPYKWNERISMAVDAVEIAIAAGITVIQHDADELLGIEESPPAPAVDGEGAPADEGVVGASDGAPEDAPTDSEPAPAAEASPATEQTSDNNG